MRTVPWRVASIFAHPLVRGASIYAASTFVSRAMPFFLLPVLTRYLSPADYGIVSMFLFTVLILDPFISLGVGGAVTVKYYDKTTDVPTYLGTGLVMTIALAIPVELLVFLLRDTLSDITRVPPEWLLLVVPFIVARAVVAVPLSLLMVREKALLFGVVQNAQSAAVISLSLLLVVGLGGGWRGRLEAELITWCTFAIAGVVVLRRSGWLRLVFIPPYARHLAGFGVPLIPHALGSILIVQTDRLLLTNLVGVEETGLYTVGYQLALVLELIAISFNNAFAPWLYRHLGDADYEMRRKLVRYTYVQFAGMAVLALAVAVGMPWLAGQLLDPSFAGSGPYVGWFVLGFLFSAMYYMVVNYIFYAQQTFWLAAVTITVGVVNIPLTYFLIQLNGGIGAAQATAVALGLSFLFTWLVSQRIYPMPWFGGGKTASIKR